MTWANDGFYTDYDYDQLDRVTKIRENGATSGIGVLASYSYDSQGRRSSITYGNGTARTYAYDTAGRAVGVKLDLAGSVNDLTIGQVAGSGSPVAYNPAGQIVSLARDNDAYAWTAHALFERDYAVNGLNQYTSAGGAAFAYDGRGNLTASGTAAYAYTRLNELKSAPNLAAGSGTVTLTYDPQGRLSQYNTGSAIKLLYAGPNLVAEIGATGTILRRYVHGTGSDEPIVWYEGADTSSRRWLQADQLGSIAAVSDGSGAMLGINRYDEYGIPQAGNLGRFQYTGQTWFGELGLYNYKARWYSASLGRFLQTDPIGYKDQLNLYAYVGNDPIGRTDPTGLIAYGTPLTGCDPGSGKVSMACGGTIGSDSVKTEPTAEKSNTVNHSSERGPGAGHNNPPLDLTDLLKLLRAPGITIIGCILACKGSGMNAQILQGDLIRSSTAIGNVPGKWEVRQTQERDFNSDWNYLARNSGNYALDYAA